MECLRSSVYFLLSCRDVVALLTSGGVIPARRYTFSTDVFLDFLLWSAGAVVLMVSGLAPHFVFDRFLRILFRADVLLFRLCMCSLYLSVLSKNTPRYTGLRICSRCLLYHVIFNFMLAFRLLR